MTLLSDIEQEADPTHLLLIGNTKAGKSYYAAQAAIDGHTLIFVDSDNGISALRRALKDHPEAMKRIIYFRTREIYPFMKGLLESKVFRWNMTRDAVAGSYDAKDEDKIVKITPSKLPTGVIIVVDSWTSVALGAMNDGADKKSVTLDNMGEQMQSVYGEANMKLTLLCAILQQCRFHTVVIAHEGLYERYEKPIGSSGTVKQKEMILRETTKIPRSSSKAHGLEMGKYFTDIGWLQIDRANDRILDFTTEHGRVSGGTVNQKGTVNSMSFSKTFAKPADVEIDDSWISYMTGEEFKESVKKPSAGKAGVSAGEGELPKTPAKGTVSSMLSR